MKNNIVPLSILFILLILSPFSSKAQELIDAKAIITAVDDNIQGKSNKSITRMSIVRPTYKRTITMKGWSLGKKYYLAYVTAPAKEKGQVILKYEDDMWQYIPSINRMMKLPPSMMLQGFLGSDYTNDDVIKESSIVEDYQHTLLKKDSIDGRLCYLIKMIPHEEANVVWGQVYYWVDCEYLVVREAKYYDEENYLVRTIYGKKVKKFDGRYETSLLEVVPEDNPKNKTIVETLSLNFDISISSHFFSQQNMKRIH